MPVGSGGSPPRRLAGRFARNRGPRQPQNGPTLCEHEREDRIQRQVRHVRGGVFARQASRERSRARRPGNGASHGYGRPGNACVSPASIGGGLALPFAGGTQAFAGRAVPRTPCPRKQLRGTKSDQKPLEPTPTRGTTPSAGGNSSTPALHPPYRYVTNSAPRFGRRRASMSGREPISVKWPWAGEADEQGLFTLRNGFARANPVRSEQSGGGPGNGVLGTASWARRPGNAGVPPAFLFPGASPPCGRDARVPRMRCAQDLPPCEERLPGPPVPPPLRAVRPDIPTGGARPAAPPCRRAGAGR